MNDLVTFLEYPLNKQRKQLRAVLEEATVEIEFNWMKGEIADIPNNFDNQDSSKQLHHLRCLLLDYININIAEYVKNNIKSYKCVINPLVYDLKAMALNILADQHEEQETQKMVRSKLKAIGNAERHTFTATFCRTGFKTYNGGFSEKCSPTLLLKDVYLEDQLITDHLWFNYGKGFQKLGKLVVGDRIQFNGKISTYEKKCRTSNGSRFKIQDYKIGYPTKIKMLTKRTKIEPVPDSNAAIIGMILIDNQQFYLANDRGTSDDAYYIKQYQSWQQKIQTQTVTSK